MSINANKVINFSQHNIREFRSGLAATGMECVRWKEGRRKFTIIVKGFDVAAIIDIKFSSVCCCCIVDFKVEWMP